MSSGGASFCRGPAGRRRERDRAARCAAWPRSMAICSDSLTLACPDELIEPGRPQRRVGEAVRFRGLRGVVISGAPPLCVRRFARPTARADRQAWISWSVWTAQTDIFGAGYARGGPAVDSWIRRRVADPLRGDFRRGSRSSGSSGSAGRAAPGFSVFGLRSVSGEAPGESRDPPPATPLSQLPRAPLSAASAPAGASVNSSTLSPQLECEPLSGFSGPMPLTDDSNADVLLAQRPARRARRRAPTARRYRSWGPTAAHTRQALERSAARPSSRNPYSAPPVLAHNQLGRQRDFPHRSPADAPSRRAARRLRSRRRPTSRPRLGPRTFAANFPRTCAIMSEGYT